MTSCFVTASIASIAATSIAGIGRPPVPDRLGRLLRHHAELGHRVERVRLDLEPDAVAGLRLPDARSSRGGRSGGSCGRLAKAKLDFHLIDRSSRGEGGPMSMLALLLAAVRARPQPALSRRAAAARLPRRLVLARHLSRRRARPTPIASRRCSAAPSCATCTSSRARPRLIRARRSTAGIRRRGASAIDYYASDGSHSAGAAWPAGERPGLSRRGAPRARRRRDADPQLLDPRRRRRLCRARPKRCAARPGARSGRCGWSASGRAIPPR